LPEEDLLSWAWRIPFLFSSLLVIVALYIRKHLEETPEYVRAVAHAHAQQRAASIPLREVLQKQPKVLLCGFLAMCGANAATYTLNSFALSYMVNNLAFSRADGLNILILASIAGIVCTPLMGKLSDRFGYGRVYVLGTLFIGLYAAPMFWLLDSRSLLLASVAMIIGYGVGFASVAGSQGAFLTSLFPIRYRFTGITFVREMNGATIAGMTPFIATWLTQQAGGRSTYLVSYLITLCLISIIAILSLRHHQQLPEESLQPARA
jgi:MHS family shikimate/dehydroshikimate transporter-like MFS transporter